MDETELTVFLNGEFRAAHDANVSVFDRAFLYGDGLFETIRVSHGRPFRWLAHLARLQRGVDFLGLPLSFAPSELLTFGKELIERTCTVEGLLRITLSRGAGGQGYSPIGAHQPQLVMAVRLAPIADANRPTQWRMSTSSVRIAARDPLAGFKSCSKLPNVVARTQAESKGTQEGLILNSNEEVAEGSSSNIFWLEGDKLWTPPLSSGALPGITRATVQELCAHLGISHDERACRVADLHKADGVFLTLTSQGIVEVVAIDHVTLPASPHTRLLHQHYQRLVRDETER